VKKQSVTFWSNCISITYSNYSRITNFCGKRLLNWVFHYCWTTLPHIVYNTQKLPWHTVHRVRSHHHGNHEFCMSYCFF